MDFKQEIERITQVVEKNKLEKAKLEERQRNLVEEKDELVAELKEHDLTEDTVDAWLVEKEEELTKDIEECKQILEI